MGICCVLEQLDDLLGREVVGDAAYLTLERLDVALAANHLLLLQHQQLSLLGELVELALALSLLLLG